jgi:hypothetical protein
VRFGADVVEVVVVGAAAHVAVGLLGFGFGHELNGARGTISLFSSV